MQISVLIPSYYGEALLPVTLGPLLADPATAEVVVVVDGSPDGSFELLQRMARDEPRLRPFYLANRGRTGAWQFALEQSRCAVVLSIDQDVIAHPGLVSGHAALHEASGNRMVAGYMPTLRPRRAPGSFVIDRYADEYERVCAAWERDPDTILRRLWGGNLSMPKEALLAAGGCDTGVGLQYSHDQELGLRLREQGLEPVFDRRLRADHHFERSVAGFLKSARQQGHDLVIIERLHPGLASFPRWRDDGAGGQLRRFALRPRGYAAVSRVGIRLMSAAARLRLWRLEERIGVFLETIEMQQGILRELSALGRSSGRSASAEVAIGAQAVGSEPLAPVGSAQ